MFQKRGISPVIATVLLLLLTLVIAGILTYYVLPFVNNTLKGSGECFELLNTIELEQNKYSCYYVPGGSSTQARTAFTLRVDYAQSIDLKVIAYKPRRTSGESFVLKNGVDYPSGTDVRMLDKGWSDPLDIPSNGMIRTYVLVGAYEKIEVNPILKSGKVCNEQRSIILPPCTDAEVIAELSTGGG
jgi:flagellin-like protein